MKETDNPRKTVFNVLTIVSFSIKNSKDLIEFNNKKTKGIKKPKTGGIKQKKIKKIFCDLLKNFNLVSL